MSRSLSTRSYPRDVGPSRPQQHDVLRWRTALDDAYYKRTSQSYQNLRQLVISANSIEAVEIALNQLDPSDIPYTEDPITIRVDVAEGGIADLTAIIQCLIVTPRPPVTDAEENLRLRIIRALLERWTHVLRWLVYLVEVYGPARGEHRRYVGKAADLMRPVLNLVSMREGRIGSAEAVALKEEFLFLPDTLDFIFFLLWQVDPRDGCYYSIPIPEGGTGCLIIYLVKAYVLSSPKAIPTLVDRLKNISSHKRRKLVDALVLRVPQTANLAAALARNFHTRGVAVSSALKPLHDAVETTFNLIVSASDLIAGDASISPAFMERKFITHYALALTTIAETAHDILTSTTPPSTGDDHDQNQDSTPLALGRERPDKLFWTHLSGTSIHIVSKLIFRRLPNGPHAVVPACAGGLLSVLLRVLTHLEPTDEASELLIDEAITYVLSYMPCRRVWKTLSGGTGAAGAWREVIGEARRQSKGGKQVCREIRSVMAWGEDVFEGRKRVEVELRSNLNHPEYKKLGMFDKPPRNSVKSCSICHAVQYCSPTCQREDWKRFHSKECAKLARCYAESKEKGRWISTPERRDYLAFLQGLANELIMPVHDLHASHSKDGQRLISSHPPTPSYYHPDTSITFIDWVSHEGLAARVKYPIAYLEKVAWNPVNKAYAHGAWVERVRETMKDVDRSWVTEGPATTWCAVECVFSFSATESIWVFTRLRWDDSEPAGRNYRVGSGAVCRIGSRLVLDDIHDILPRV